ncbi:hypothetical protein I3843_03G230700 [Carya illinoinensis]|nr:hypothetical protein I3843_03G230700 [Carya illinoinensis]
MFLKHVRVSLRRYYNSTHLTTTCCFARFFNIGYSLRWEPPRTFHFRSLTNEASHIVRAMCVCVCLEGCPSLGQFNPLYFFMMFPLPLKLELTDSFYICGSELGVLQ